MNRITETTPSPAETTRFPLDSSALSAITYHPSGVTFVELANGGSETHNWAAWEDVRAVLLASSAGSHYWKTFRGKYKDPQTAPAPPKPEGAARRRSSTKKPAPTMMTVLAETGVSVISHSFMEDDEAPQGQERRISRATRFERVLTRLGNRVAEIVALADSTIDTAARREEALAVRVTNAREAAAADALARTIRDEKEALEHRVFGPFVKASHAVWNALTSARKDRLARLDEGLRHINTQTIAWNDRVEQERKRIAKDAQERAQREAEERAQEEERKRRESAQAMADDGFEAAAADLMAAPLPVFAPAPVQAPAQAAVAEGTSVNKTWVVNEDDFDVDKLIVFLYHNPKLRKTLGGVNWKGAKTLAKALGHDDGSTDFPMECGIIVEHRAGVVRR